MQAPIGVILAGGRGTRMGGVAKADIQLGGERLLDHATARLEPQVGRVIVNANDPLACDLSVVADSMVGHLGPLAGVLAGLDWAADHGQDCIVTVAVDTPFFPCDLVPQLMLAAHDGFAIATTAEGPQGTFGLWPTRLIAPLRAFLEAGGRKVRSFATAHNAGLTLFPTTSPDSFFNINTPDDLEQAATWL